MHRRPRHVGEARPPYVVPPTAYGHARLPCLAFALARPPHVAGGHPRRPHPTPSWPRARATVPPPRNDLLCLQASQPALGGCSGMALRFPPAAVACVLSTVKPEWSSESSSRRAPPQAAGVASTSLRSAPASPAPALEEVLPSCARKKNSCFSLFPQLGRNSGAVQTVW